MSKDSTNSGDSESLKIKISRKRTAGRGEIYMLDDKPVFHGLFQTKRQHQLLNSATMVTQKLRPISTGRPRQRDSNSRVRKREEISGLENKGAMGSLTRNFSFNDSSSQPYNSLQTFSALQGKPKISIDTLADLVSIFCSKCDWGLS